MVRRHETEMYSPHNERKSVVAERFIRTSKDKIHKYVTSISKNIFQKSYTPNCSEIFVTKKIKNTVSWA